MIFPEKTILCYKCQIVIGLGRGNARRTCQSCKDKKLTEYYKTNRDFILEKQLKYAASHREEERNRVKAWKLANKSRAKANEKNWVKNNPDRVKLIKNKYVKNNLDKSCAATRKRQLLNQTPKWITKAQMKEIESFYTLAKEIQWLSEEPLEVDHIVPIKGSSCSGLHVPWNLQILPRSLNRSKGATWQ